jgi:exosortase/archaeosortase family protein
MTTALSDPPQPVEPSRLRRRELLGNPRHRVAAVLATIAVAYHFSLLTLLRSLGVETPLAYLGLVPVIALMLAAARHQAGGGPDIDDRQLDYIVGVPLLAAALAMVVILPVRLSTLFWVWRLDLLSLPLFVAGAVTITFGVRAMWRLRFPIGFLALAWPLPYTLFLTSWLQSFTNLTISGLKVALTVVPVGRSIPGSDGSLFAITHGTSEFVVSVASACSGVNGMLGFVLAGAAFASLVKGGRLPKLAWLIGGLALIWLLNVGRILLIFAVGSAWGERVAIEGLHPYIGLVVFCLGVLLMILAMPLFGLHLTPSGRRAPIARRAPVTAPVTRGAELFSAEYAWAPEAPEAPVAPAPPAPSPRRLPPLSRVAVGMVAVVGLLLALANRDLRDYELVADDLGAPRLAAFAVDPPEPDGWSAQLSNSYDWATRFFGDDSTWNRYSYTSSGMGPLNSSSRVIADVVSTSDLASFTAYGLEACYNFHGYSIDDTRTVDLGGGITGKVVSHFNTSTGGDWTSVYWHWPVQTDAGVRFERVVMMMVNAASSSISTPNPGPSVARSLGLGVDNKLQDDETSADDQRLAQTREFLVAFSQNAVAEQAAQAQPA